MKQKFDFFKVLLIIFLSIFFGCKEEKKHTSLKHVDTKIDNEDKRHSKTKGQSIPNKDIPIIAKINRDHVFTKSGDRINLPGIGLDHVIRIVIVRHAEKVMDNSRDPGLSRIGKERAMLLAGMMEDFGVAKVYATKFKRAMFTAIPSANKFDASIKTYSSSDLENFIANDVKTEFGKNLFLVGHSNTIPTILDLLQGERKHKDLSEFDYDNLFIANILPTGDTEIIAFRMEL